MDIHNRLEKRGSVIVLRGNKLVPVVQFMFNPQEVTRDRGWIHGEAPVPGRSSPFYGGGYGSPETFSFTLQLDADRGFLEARRRNQIVSPEDVDQWMSLTSDINQREDLRFYIDSLKSFIFPESKPAQGTSRLSVPQRIWIDLGSALSGEVQFDSIEERSFRYSATMTVLKADLTINGHMIEDTNVTNSSFLAKYTSQGSNAQNPVQNSTFVQTPGLAEEIDVEDLFA